MSNVMRRLVSRRFRNFAALLVAASTVFVVVITPTVAEAATPTSSAVYRFWSPEFKSHFFTMSVQERDHIITSYPDSVWTYEGGAYGAFDTQVAGTVPLYRFWSTKFKGHFFTTSEAEKDQVIAIYDDVTWLFEGVAYYVYPTDSLEADSRAVARFWSQDNKHHFYTASAAERDHVIATYPAHEWVFEQDAFRVPNAMPELVPAPPKPLPPVQFADGTYLVGSNIPAGIYRTDGTTSCYWERLSGLSGNFDDIIANSYSTSGPQLVAVSNGDVAFKTSGCGTWRSTWGAYPSVLASQIPDGMYLVGKDIQSGTYTSSGGSSCYWERLEGVGGTNDQIIANDYGSSGTRYVTITNSDVAFSSRGCNIWTKVP